VGSGFEVTALSFFACGGFSGDDSPVIGVNINTNFWLDCRFIIHDFSGKMVDF
jgi:hypothetical protein